MVAAVSINLVVPLAAAVGGRIEHATAERFPHPEMGSMIVSRRGTVSHSPL